MPGKNNRNGRRVNEAKLILKDSSPWAIKEAYKGLRTNLLFSLPGTGAKVIGVTSAFMHEGKSINAMNTAISLAQLDKKVMLIEADLRRPTISARFQVKGTPGLTDALVGQANFVDCVRRLKDYGIDVMPAGSLPPDPTWLLQSKQIRALIDALKEQYDYIVFDLPPVTSVADASIMAPNLDGFLFVVRHSVTDVRAVRDALSQLKRARARIIGFVYNDASSAEGGYYASAYN